MATFPAAVLGKAALRLALALLEAKRLRSAEEAVKSRLDPVKDRHQLQARGEQARKTKARRVYGC